MSESIRTSIINKYKNLLNDFVISINENYLKWQETKDKIFYLRLKDAIWNLDLSTKHLAVEGKITENQWKDFMDYYWGLLYD